ncbi:TPA: hypothetical protein HA246_05285 [Candidatus Woesearchaeota archaeon]|nr:hypothetical protein [Candidatus Woesearchaeota archaeon]
MVMAYSFIELKITNDYIKKIFKIIVIIIAVFFILTTLIKLILISSLFKYESCGREFNELYIEYAKSNDPSFCLDSKRNLNTFIGFKGDDYCKTPYKDTIIPTQDDFAATCITSFAKYTNDISHCDLIESNNLSISHSLSDSGFSGNKYHCIMAYAIDKLKPDYCDTLPKEGDYSDRNKCLKMVSRKSGDIS